MSIKITNKLKVHGENTTQKYTDAQYNTDTERINGAQPGTPISSKLINTGLRNATLVTSALIEALKTVVPDNNDLTTAITVGTNTTHAALVAALTEALVKIKVEHAATADNVISGAIVEETTRARESKQGYGISLGLNSKLQFKTTWLGTHKNNDVIYYSTAGSMKGFYIVKGLSEETTTQAAGTLTIASGQTPSTHSANLQRLTFETTIGTNTSLSKTDTVSSSSTTNQLATAKGVYDYAQAKLAKHTSEGVKILTRGLTDGAYYDLDKVTSVGPTSTDMQIPTAKTLHDDFQTKIASHTTAGVKILSRSTTDGALTDLDKVMAMPTTPTDSQIPTAKLLKNYTTTELNNYAQPIISAGTTNDILVKTSTKGVLSTLAKVTSIHSSSTHSQLPTAKAVYDYVENTKWTLIRDTTSWTTISNEPTNSAPTIISCSKALSTGDVLAFELAFAGYTNRPFIVQTVLTTYNTNPDAGNIFKAEGLTSYGQVNGNVNTYREVRHYIKFSYSEGTNLRFKTVGTYGESYPTATPFAINYKKDDYDNTLQSVTSESTTNQLQIRRIWRL